VLLKNARQILLRRALLLKVLIHSGEKKLRLITWYIYVFITFNTIMLNPRTILLPFTRYGFAIWAIYSDCTMSQDTAIDFFQLAIT
jgi:hypothetical protein